MGFYCGIKYFVNLWNLMMCLKLKEKYVSMDFEFFDEC